MAVKLRVRFYSCLVTGGLLSAAETSPMPKNHEKRMEVVQATNLRRIHLITYSAHVPRAPVRRSSEVYLVESRLVEARLRTGGLACRDTRNSFVGG